jgi:hypothetical protein
MEAARMDSHRHRAAAWAAIVFTGLTGCGRSIDPGSLPESSRTLVEVGKRLGQRLSPERLAELGEDETRLVASLNAAERLSLGRAYLRFRVDRPVIVDVAVPNGPLPFWLDDLGFRPAGQLGHADGPFRLYSRQYPAGTVGLGVNSLDRRSRGHYAVFVRSDGSIPDVKLTPESPGRVLRIVKGSGPYSDETRPFATIPDHLRSAVLIQPRFDDRHRSALVKGRLWKTRVVSTAHPDQIVTSFGADPEHSLVWTWRTAPSVTSSEIRVEPVNGGAALHATGDFVEIRSDGLLNDPIVHRHRIKLAGLAPDTLYRYAIRDGASWTGWKSVRTAPATDRDYSFLTMGDPQCGLEEWGQLLHEARRRHPSSGFLVIAGDLVDRGNERTNWDHFFMRAEGVFDQLPLMPCVGNHEYLDKGPDIFCRSFVLPANGPSGIPHGLTYSFEYSDSFVAVLDSNPAVYSKAKAQTLAAWLDGALARTKARWKFVVFHHPVYPSHPSRAQPQLAEAWIPVFDKHKVDLVLQGHDHAYLRTYPLRADRPEPGGTVYVVSVSGQKFVELADRPYTAKGFANVATYQRIEISPRNGTLVYQAFDVDGNERDRMEIVKPIGPEVAQRPALDGKIQRSADR